MFTSPPWPPSALWSPPPICKKQCLLRSGKEGSRKVSGGLPRGSRKVPERFPKGFRKGFRKVPERFPKGSRNIPERFPNVSEPAETFRVNIKCYKYEVFNIAPFPERFRGPKPFGNLSETFREPFGNLSGTVRKTFGNLSGTFRDPPKPFGSPPETFREPSGNLSVTFREPFGTPRKLSGRPRNLSEPLPKLLGAVLKPFG